MLLNAFYSLIYSAEGGDNTDLIKQLHELVDTYNKIAAELKKKEYTAHKDLLKDVKKEDEKDITSGAAGVQVKIMEMLKELTEFNSKHLKELDEETRKKVLEKTKNRMGTKADSETENEKDESKKDKKDEPEKDEEESKKDENKNITKL